MTYKKVIPCPHCGEMTIEIHETPKSLSCKRGFMGKKGLYLYKGHTTILTEICPNCNRAFKDKEELSHEQRIKRLCSAGLPTRIEAIN